MHGELTIPHSLLWGFLLALTRVSSALIFVPIPGFRTALSPARAGLVLAITLLLMPAWPSVDMNVGAGRLALWLLSEAALGIAVGLGAALAGEVLVLASQIFGLQAGYSYASTIDPTTEADSTVLQILAQLTGSFLFFAFGLHHQLIRIFARTLETIPPGGFAADPAAAQALIRLGGAIFVSAWRLALPVVALMVLVDVALALLGRIHAQMQLLALAFPVKMLVAMAVLVMLTPVFPLLYRSFAEQALGGVSQLLLRAR